MHNSFGNFEDDFQHGFISDSYEDATYPYREMGTLKRFWKIVDPQVLQEGIKKVENLPKKNHFECVSKNLFNIYSHINCHLFMYSRQM